MKNKTISNEALTEANSYIRNVLAGLEISNGHHRKAMASNDTLIHWLAELDEEKSIQLMNTKLNFYSCFKIDRWNGEQGTSLDWTESNFEYIES